MHYTSLKLGGKLRLDTSWTELHFESSSESQDVFMVFPLHCKATHLFMFPFLSFSTASPNRVQTEHHWNKQDRSMYSFLIPTLNIICFSVPRTGQAEIKCPETIVCQWTKQEGRLKYNIFPFFFNRWRHSCDISISIWSVLFTVLKYWVTWWNEGVLA